MLGEVAKNIAKTALNVSAKTVALPLEASIGLAGGITERFTKSFITTDPKKYGDTFLKAGLNKKGSALMLGIGTASGISDGYDSYTVSRMGTVNGFEISTPKMPTIENRQDMAESYGAGGDLVFALNRNRRG